MKAARRQEGDALAFDGADGGGFFEVDGAGRGEKGGPGTGGEKEGVGFVEDIVLGAEGGDAAG